MENDFLLIQTENKKLNEEKKKLYDQVEVSKEEIEEYQNQLDLYFKVLKQMEEKIENN